MNETTTLRATRPVRCALAEISAATNKQAYDGHHNSELSWASIRCQVELVPNVHSRFQSLLIFTVLVKLPVI